MASRVTSYLAEIVSLNSFGDKSRMDWGITKVEDILKAYRGACQSIRSRNTLWWRGHASNDGDWKLLPAVFRKPAMTRNNEVAMTLDFFNQARSRYSHCPSQDDKAAWLFLMQHFGLPTRLLDWTASPLIAAYFAVSDEKYGNQPGLLWAFDPFEFNKALVNNADVPSADHQKLRPHFAAPFDTDELPPCTVVAIYPAQVDTRMLVQSSAFTIHSSETAIEDMHSNSRWLKSFAIPANEKRRILGDLRELGIRRCTLFPDLQNLAADLKLRYFDDRTM